MKRLLIFLLLISGFASAQTYQKVNSYGVWWFRGLFDSTLTTPIGLNLRSNLTRPGAIAWNTTDSAFYGWTGYSWLKQGSTGNIVIPGNNYTFSGWDLSYGKDTAHAGEGTVMNLGGDTLLNVFRLSLYGGHVSDSGKIVK